MNYAIWAEDVNDAHARVVRSSYYGTITYIDDCIGRILDAVEARGDAANTMICFFSDHGDISAIIMAGRRKLFRRFGTCSLPGQLA